MLEGKGQAKVARNKIIRDFIESKGVAVDVRAVLQHLQPEYRQWLVSEGYRKGGKRF